MSTGVFLARMQPFHNGHKAIIDKMLSENDTVVIMIGSANVVSERNPIPISMRLTILEDYLDSLPESDTDIVIQALDDLTQEGDDTKAWGTYLYANAVAATGESEFTMYYSDGYEIITKWFEPFLLQSYISLALIARQATADGMSATIIRKAIVDNNHTVVNKGLPKVTLDKLEVIKAYVEIQDLIKT